MGTQKQDLKLITLEFGSSHINPDTQNPVFVFYYDAESIIRHFFFSSDIDTRWAGGKLLVEISKNAKGYRIDGNYMTIGILARDGDHWTAHKNRVMWLCHKIEELVPVCFFNGEKWFQFNNGGDCGVAGEYEVPYRELYDLVDDILNNPLPKKEEKALPINVEKRNVIVLDGPGTYDIRKILGKNDSMIWLKEQKVWLYLGEELPSGIQSVIKEVNDVERPEEPAPEHEAPAQDNSEIDIMELDW